MKQKREKKEGEGQRKEGNRGRSGRRRRKEEEGGRRRKRRMKKKNTEGNIYIGRRNRRNWRGRM